MAEPPNGWAVSGRLSLAALGLILGQTAAFSWWAASLSARSEDHDRRILSVERTLDQRSLYTAQLEGRLAAIESGIRELVNTALRLERRIDAPPTERRP